MSDNHQNATWLSVGKFLFSCSDPGANLRDQITRSLRLANGVANGFDAPLNRGHGIVVDLERRYSHTLECADLAQIGGSRQPYNKCWPEGNNRLDVRRQKASNFWQSPRLQRVIAVLGDPNHFGAGADRKERLCYGWCERYYPTAAARSCDASGAAAAHCTREHSGKQDRAP